MKRSDGEETNPWKTRTTFTVLPKGPGDYGRISLAKRVFWAEFKGVTSAGQAATMQKAPSPDPSAQFYSLNCLVA